MNKVYQFAIKLQDLFSPQMQRVATMFEQKTSFMTRLSERVKNMLNSSAQSVSTLRQKLSGLAAGFKVKIDDSQVGKASGKISGLLTKLKSLAGQSAIVGGLVGGSISGIAMGAVDGIMAQIGDMSEKTIGAAQKSQSTRFTLNELMGKTNAGALVKGVDKYAPEKRDELLSSAQKLSGSGVESSKLMDTLKYLNNISALTGSKVDDLAMIQSKIKATGYVQGDEINMFKERGINLNPYLAQVMKIKEGDIAKAQSKGQISYDIFDKAMQKYAGKGSKYEQVYERKMMSTTEGKEELVSGKLNAKLRGIGELMLPIKDSILSMFNDILNGTGPLVGVFEKLWSIVSPITTGIIDLLKWFGILNEQGAISQGVFTTLSTVWDFLGNILKIVGSALWVVAKVIEYLIGNPVVLLIAGIYGIVKAWGFLNVVMAMNPFVLIIAGVVLLVAAIMTAWDKFDGFREAVLKTWEVIKSVFSNIGGFLSALFTGDIAGALAIIGKTVSQGIDNGQKRVSQDRLEKLNERRAGRKSRDKSTDGLDFTDGKGTGAGSLGAAAGLSSTVGNSKSSNVTISIKSLIENNQITVASMQSADLKDLETQMIDLMLRIANSGTRAITS
ncbi:hypothetical protein [Dyadobacter frigoris]|uniref:Tape measure protein n=1 Tax=Dyadobacter frigoris TaxID=2576211 RepID=A0A4U6CXP4_9BACT|nr:hypothetical protein [Dyadobacter frigoris]TKT89472.1 hypothetical protein FDK13_24325 [Dyadobacter frigoris]